MTAIRFEKKPDNEVHGIVHASEGVLEEISNFFAFRPGGYQFMPAFKSGFWDGFVREFNPRRPILRLGLRSVLQRFCDERNYEFIEEGFPAPEDFSEEDAIAWLSTLVINGKDGKRIYPREHQVQAFTKAINRVRGVFLSPTASGKSLILYLIARYLIDHDEAKRLLITVPTVGLVSQLADDFKTYASGDNWDGVDDLVQIGGGKGSQADRGKITISTWQTIITYPKDWFLQFTAVFGDEVHTNKAASLTKIMESLLRARWRIGVTGTLDDSIIHKTIIVGHFGDVHRVITTVELMEQGSVAKLKIIPVRLNYADSDRIEVRGLTYEEELKYILAHPERMKKIITMCRAFDGNILVLFNRIDHGKAIYQALKTATNRPLYYVSGETPPDVREDVRKAIDKHNDCIVVASLGTFSTGIDAPEIHAAIFAHPFKAKIKALQSIGRTIRVSKDGRPATLFDAIDDLSWKGRENYAKKHAAERMKIYMSEGFDIQPASIKVPPAERS